MKSEPVSFEIPTTLAEAEKALAASAARIERIRVYNPAVTFRPNRVQKQILKMFDDGIRDGCRSFGILPGNGVGKSTLLSALIYNIAAGPQNDFFELPFIQKWPFKNRELRLVCDRADILEQSGGMWQAIHQWWPADGYKAKQQGYDHEAMYDLPNGFTLSVRRPDQPSKVHESNTLSGIFMNEPPESPMVWQQYGARLRGSGFRSLWGTVWKSEMTWVAEEIVDNTNARHLFADLHQCCSDCYPDGHMTHQQIEAVIADYPEEQREARRTGMFGGLSTTVFTVNPEVHFYEDDEPMDTEDGVAKPKPLQYYASLDPHPHKPWVYLVGGLDERGEWWLVDEWPHDTYHKIRSDYRGLAEYAKIIRNYDGDWNVTDRVIDRAGSSQTIRKDYGTTTVRKDLDAQHNIRFKDGNRHVEDAGDEIGGITMVKNLLRHDPQHGIFTKIHIGPRCRNLRFQLQKLKLKKDPDTGLPTSKVDDEFLDFPRALMYLVMAGFNYRHGMTPDERETRRLSAHEREIYRVMKERGYSVPQAANDAQPVNWFN